MTPVTHSMEAGQCLNRLSSLLDDYSKTKPLLLYAALELRFSIERTLFEYLVLIRNFSLSKQLEKLYRADDLKAAILAEEPRFTEKIEFMATLAPFVGIEREVRIPDLDVLSDCYGKLGRYLHAPKRAEKTWLDMQWWIQLESLIATGASHLFWLHSGAVGFVELNEKGLDLFERYESGSMSLAEVKKFLEDYYAKKPEQPSQPSPTGLKPPADAGDRPAGSRGSP